MRLGVMCSGNGTNFENIITNPICNKHEVVLMIHNTKQCGAVKRAAKFGIPHVRIPHKDEERMIDMFNVWRVDLIVLAGYMRVIKNPSAFPAPIINIHPYSFLQANLTVSAYHSTTNINYLISVIGTEHCPSNQVVKNF